MKYSKFADRYFEKNKDIFENIRTFEERRKLRLFDKLLLDKNEINFLSWLSEMKFGLRVDNFCSNVFYNKQLDNQTPDWVALANNQTIIFEVVRINLDEKLVYDKIEEFKKPSSENGEVIAKKTFSKTLDGKYFYGAKDKIVRKESIYRQLIESNRLPFIICVDCSEIELFTFHNDFLDFFIADGRNGYFIRDGKFGQNVSGIFILVPFDGYKFINNSSSINMLNAENFNAVMSVCD